MPDLVDNTDTVRWLLLDGACMIVGTLRRLQGAWAVVSKLSVFGCQCKAILLERVGFCAHAIIDLVVFLLEHEILGLIG